MARTWLSMRVELTGRHGERLWPRPGRIFAGARRHTSDLADAIDDAFARWDRSHLQQVTLADGTRRAAGKATTASHPCHRTRGWPISPASDTAPGT